MDTNTFQSAALNEIYNSVFDEIFEEFLDEKEDEGFNFEEWLDEQSMEKTNSEGCDDCYRDSLSHLRLAEVIELLREINEEAVSFCGDEMPVNYTINSVVANAVWAVGQRIRTNNSNPTDNEFTRMNPDEE